MILKDLISLTKPGIILGNLVSASGAFFLGTGGALHPLAFVITLIGLSCLIAGGCVYNNCIDRDIDGLMQRTQSRPLVQGRVSIVWALALATLLSLLGLFLLYNVGDTLGLILAIFGLFSYVVFYSLWLKRTRWGTWGGSISGAMPPLIAYTCATHHLDVTALLLFLMYCLWQIPHAQALGIMHLNDYRRANIPVVSPGESGIAHIKSMTPWYVLGLCLLSISLFFIHRVGLFYLFSILLMSTLWMRASILKRDELPHRSWAKKSFVYSLYMVMLLSFMMSIDVKEVSGLDTPQVAQVSSFSLKGHELWLAWLNAMPVQK
ncbi:MAG: protoheme IX farnesyltransferase [Ferrovum sp. 37-45-19]|nr:MAG: protoheme IX farnesyltransferase [Ferrovum sp. 21-44-67]OYV94151.1 MAG: protoheme IX farnesyltransferase [Ferrovum sp. 37-45-19]OZB34327.1 MAG: protoheme IX farnesyltransferase [Ferrovum sp. 34-44-207]HQT81418.1 heme o synthase [Ferrovaceae bacterium]HQU06305.1 heme o synthase [Ferrovaceae bacterium]